MLSKRSSWASQRVPASPAQSCAAGSLLFPSASFIALLPLWHQLKRVWKSAHRASPSPHRSPCTTPPVAPPLWHARGHRRFQLRAGGARPQAVDRESVGEGKSGSVRVEFGGRRHI